MRAKNGEQIEGTPMDVTELCRRHVAVFSQVELELCAIICAASRLGLHSVTGSLSRGMPDFTHILFQGRNHPMWDASLWRGEFSHLRVDLRSHPDTYYLEDDAYFSLFDDFVVDYRRLDQLLREHLGTESFAGRRGSPNFPPDYGANYLTEWRLTDRRILLSFEDHKREDPLIISLSVLPTRSERS